MTKKLLKMYLIGLLLIGGMNFASAQDVFLQGTYMEVGVSPGGSLGTDNNAPSGYNTTDQLGFIADVDKDGWTEGQPAFIGDYFMPGSPEEGWSIEWDVAGDEYNFNNVYLEGEDEVTLESHIDKSYGDYKVSEWIGNATGDAGQSLKVKQVLQFHKDSLQFSFTITMKNTGSVTLESPEYIRNLDPDQEEPITGDYTTRNYVAHQPGIGGNPDTAMVVAEALSYSNYKIIIASINSHAKVSTEGFDNRDPDEILDSPNAPSKQFPEEEDQAIAIAYRFGDLAPGDSVVFTYFYILKEEQIAVVTPNTINTATVAPTMFCPGTATAVTVPFNATGTFNAGNVFTAQLSGPTGSFASPTTIGTLSATASGTINATIPAGAAAGSGYRIRVVSSNPVFTGNDNGVDITGGVFVTATNGFSCGSAALTLDATASSGTINWYADASTSTSLYTGTSYTTPTLSISTTYYVQAVDGACSSTRVPVQAVISGSAPTITSSTDATRCGNGKVTLHASASSGLVKWYDDPTAGSLVFTGTDFLTPTISAGSTVTYYAEADNGCLSASRTSVEAVANEIPYINSITENSQCAGGTGIIDLEAYASNGTVNWYSAPTGGVSLHTGTTFTTPSVSETTFFYAAASDNGCSSLRVQVAAEIIVPEVTEIYEGTNCGTGTVDLEVSYNGEDVFWFDVETGGTSLMNDDDFTTPSISVTTTYYVEVVDDGCTSAVRTPVRAIIGNGTPTISASTPATICTGGKATISATATDAVINWYDDAIAGNNVFTGNDFTTPVLYADAVYYAEANNGCNVSTSRTAVNVDVNVCTALPRAAVEVSEMSVFPNPNQGSFEILTGKITEGTMDLTDNTGRIVLSGEFHDGKIMVERPELVNGFYIVRIKKDDRMAFQKIVISK